MSSSFQIGDVRPIRPTGLRPLFFVVLFLFVSLSSVYARNCSYKTMFHGTFGTPVTCSLESSNNDLSFGCNGYSGGGYWAHCGQGVATNAQCHAVSLGEGRTNCEGSVWCCTDQCAADSLNCNGTWYPESCTCLGDECKDKRQECESIGGDFVGTTDPIEQCCKGHCNLCGTAASTAMLNRIAQLCCAAGKAPPRADRACFGNSIGSGCGVSTSNICQNNSCHCVEMDDPDYVIQLGECPNYSSSSAGGSSDSGGSSSSGNGSSDSGGSSSSGGGSSGSGGPGEDFEYDYTDSLHKIIVNTGATVDAVKDLLLCFQLGNCKTDLSYTNTLLANSIHVDSLIYEFIKDRMDSTIKLDQQQIDILNQLLTQGLPGDSTLWKKTDSTTMVIYNAISENMDTTSIALARLADSLGVSTDSIIKHLDSIWKRLEPDVQDSILKYQKYATDNFDSVLYGKGKGFSLIDSLIDTSVKYFKDVVTAIDTMSMNLELGDSLYDSLHYVIDGINFIPNGIGLALGYGDTATSTLRIDLQGIRNGLDSGLGNIAGQFYGVYDSLGNLRGAVDALGNYIGDSIHGLRGDVDRLGNRMGDSLGSLHGSVNGIRGGMDSGFAGLRGDLEGYWNGSGSSVSDTNYGGFGTGDEYLEDSSGIAHIVNVGMNDPSLHYGAGGVFDTTNIVSSDEDTTGDTIYRVPLADSMRIALEASIQEDYDTLEIKYKEAFDTLKEELQLIDWDSLILAPLAAKVPNTNTCPEECFAIKSTGAPTFFGSFDLNLGLCKSLPVLGGMNVLLFVRFILRVIVAVTCVYIGAWFIAGRKT